MSQEIQSSEYSDSAILSLMDEALTTNAWKVAELYANSQKWDSDANGYYWLNSSEKIYDKTIAILRGVGGPHSDWCISSFKRLVEIHKRNLTEKKDAAR